MSDAALDGPRVPVNVRYLSSEPVSQFLVSCRLEAAVESAPRVNMIGHGHNDSNTSYLNKLRVQVKFNMLHVWTVECAPVIRVSVDALCRDSTDQI